MEITIFIYCCFLCFTGPGLAKSEMSEHTSIFRTITLCIFDDFTNLGKVLPDRFDDIPSLKKIIDNR